MINAIKVINCLACCLQHIYYLCSRSIVWLLLIIVLCNTTTGKLQVEYGLIYSSMGLFEDAITCFKRALPLLRTQQNSKLKASVVQNIGAVYNERGMYAEAVYYHREAISLHGECMV